MATKKDTETSVEEASATEVKAEKKTTAKTTTAKASTAKTSSTTKATASKTTKTTTTKTTAKKAEATAEAKPATKKATKPAVEKVYNSRVKKQYETEVVPYLVKKFNYSNINEVPKLVKIVINAGLGDIKDNAKSMQIAHDELKLIAGQKPVFTQAKKAVANFKIRQGMNIGLKVTLRQKQMYDFFDKFVSIALPRVRDFRGVSLNSFDGRGNYALGVKEQLIFPEISYDQVEKIRGYDICFVTTAKTDEEARELLRAMGMPFAAK